MDLAAKLNLRGQRPVLVLDAPAELAGALAALGGPRLDAPDPTRPAGFALSSWSIPTA